jgi:hypothetical protein
MQTNDCELAFCRLGDQMPGLITPGLKGGRRAGGGNAFHVFMMGASAIPNIAHLGHLSPAHRGEFRVQVHNELVDLWREGLASFSRSTLLPGRKQALRARVRRGTSISLACSPAVSWNKTRGLICSYNTCSGHSVHCCICAHSSVRSRRLRFGPGIPLAFPRQRCFFQAYLMFQALARISRQVSPFGPSTCASLKAPSA